MEYKSHFDELSREAKSATNEKTLLLIEKHSSRYKTEYLEKTMDKKTKRDILKQHQKVLKAVKYRKKQLNIK